jgi:hypothetical protein
MYAMVFATERYQLWIIPLLLAEQIALQLIRILSMYTIVVKVKPPDLCRTSNVMIYS